MNNHNSWSIQLNYYEIRKNELKPSPDGLKVTTSSALAVQDSEILED